jgi:voltage-gated potassium channel
MIDVTTQTTKVYKTSNAYNIFILVLTVLSLAVMVVMLLPISEATYQLLTFYDTLISIIFLIDFFLNLKAAKKKSDYFIKQRGWLDLIGSFPVFGIAKYGNLLRLARISRLVRIARRMSGEKKKELVEDILQNRGQYAVFITIFITILVLTVASVLVLQFESQSPDALITTGWDAFWYSIVTITTVGYGDFYPVTLWGRITAMFIMFAGVGIIGALASILASLLVGSSTSTDAEQTPSETPIPALEQRLATIENELATVRRLLEKISSEHL